MVAIDKGIYREGQEIEGRTVQRIDHNGVWLVSNGKKEFVVFDNFDAETTNMP
jgi:hypothetical protein